MHYRRPEDYHVVLKKFPPRPEPSFESPEMMDRVWGGRWGCRNDVGQIRYVLMHRPGDENLRINASKLDAELGVLIDEEEQWYWRDSKAPDLALMQKQHDGLAELLRKEGAEVVYMEGAFEDPKSIFARDVGACVPGGIIIGRMGPVGKDRGGRRGEELFATKAVASLGMPILHTINGTGLFEGGGFGLLNEKTAVIGLSYRQNEEAARQIEDTLRPLGIRLIKVPLVGHTLHIDGCIVMVDHDTALVNIVKLPYWFIDEVAALGIRIVEVHPEEWGALNCLAVRPGKVIVPAPSPRTSERLTAVGIEVIEHVYNEIEKGGGSIHCSTLPLMRDWD